MLGTMTKNNFKLIVIQEGQPSRLLPVQNASTGKIDEVLVINHHVDMVLGAFQVMTPFFKGDNNGIEFFTLN